MSWRIKWISFARYFVSLVTLSHLIPGVIMNPFAKNSQFKSRALTMEHLEARLTMTTEMLTYTNGNLGNHHSIYPQASSTGRYVAFISYASNLGATDLTSTLDVYVKDRETGNVVIANTTQDGTQSSDNTNNGNLGFDLTPDGRYIVFSSNANNLVPGDNSTHDDIYRKDLQTGELLLVNRNSSGTQSNDSDISRPHISDDGRYVVFQAASGQLISGTSTSEHFASVYVKDMQTGEVKLASSATGSFSPSSGPRSISVNPTISGDGRYVTFRTNLALAANDTNGTYDIYRKDMQTGEAVLVSASAAGDLANNQSDTPHISRDGNIVVFASQASNLISGDNNSRQDLFWKNMTTGEVRRINTTDTGGELVESMFPWDASYFALYGVLSENGRFVAFNSYQSIVPGYGNGRTQVYMKDMDTGTIYPLSKDTSDSAPNNGAEFGGISGDATVAVYDSYSTITAQGINNKAQIYVTPTGYVANNAPVATTDSLVTRGNTPILIAPLFNDTDADNDSLTIQSITQPAHGTATIPNNLVVYYTPENGFTGDDSFTYTASDGHGGSVTGTIHVTVNNSVPVATLDSVVTRANTSLLIAPCFNDSDPDGDTLSITSISQPSGGTATLGPGNLVNFTPTANFTGTTTLTYALSDGHGGTATGNISIQVYNYAFLSLGRLWAIGTDAAETMVVRPGDNAGEVQVLVNNASQGTFAPQSVVLMGLGGNDTLRVDSATIGGVTRYVQIPVSMLGGNGNDTLLAKDLRSNSMLFGGDGSDSLTAGPGRDILVGGRGVDKLEGGGEEDILVGGNMTNCENQTAFDLLMMEWGRGDVSFASRRSHILGTLAGGANGWSKLDITTIENDNIADLMYGQDGRDLYFAALLSLNAMIRDSVENKNDDVFSM